MSPDHKSNECPDCGPSRRKFLKTAAGGIAAVAAANLLHGLPAYADDAPKAATSETLVTQLYKSLTEEQKKEVCFAFDHPLRTKVDNNWHIVKKTIADFYTKDQQALIRD